MPGNKISRAPENKSCAASSMSLKLKMEYKGEYMKVAESKMAM